MYLGLRIKVRLLLLFSKKESYNFHFFIFLNVRVSLMEQNSLFLLFFQRIFFSFLIFA